MNDIDEIRRHNLRQIEAENGGPASAAKLLGMSPSQFANLRDGAKDSKTGRPRGMRKETARRIEIAAGKPTGWLDVYSEPKSTEIRNVPAKESVVLRQFETGGSMGDGVELRDQPGIIESWRVSSEWLHKNVPAYTMKENLCIVTGFGDSMRPLFNPGDPLIVDRGVHAVDFDAIYFFRVGTQGYIKRLQTIPTESGLIVRAKSENGKYDSWDITEKMDFEVFGRVLKVWCSHDF